MVKGGTDAGLQTLGGDVSSGVSVMSGLRVCPVALECVQKPVCLPLIAGDGSR